MLLSMWIGLGWVGSLCGATIRASLRDANNLPSNQNDVLGMSWACVENKFITPPPPLIKKFDGQISFVAIYVFFVPKVNMDRVRLQPPPPFRQNIQKQFFSAQVNMDQVRLPPSPGASHRSNLNFIEYQNITASKKIVFGMEI